MSLKQNLHNLKEKYKGTKMAPAFNAIHTFLYLPNEVTHAGGTHIKAADDLKRTMNIVIMALIPCLLFGMFNAGYQHYAAIDNSLRADVFKEDWLYAEQQFRDHIGALPNEHRAIAVAAYAAPVDNQLHYLSQQGH